MVASGAFEDEEEDHIPADVVSEEAVVDNKLRTLALQLNSQVIYVSVFIAVLIVMLLYLRDWVRALCAPPVPTRAPVVVRVFE